MKNKGQSNILVTVLIIMLVVVAVAIIGAVVFFAVHRLDTRLNGVTGFNNPGSSALGQELIAPLNFSVITQSSDTIQLSWQKSNLTYNADYTGIFINRSTDSSFNPNQTIVKFVQYNDLRSSGNFFYYNDTGLDMDTTYYYSIFYSNTAGNTFINGLPSEFASDTTLFEAMPINYSDVNPNLCYLDLQIKEDNLDLVGLDRLYFNKVNLNSCGVLSQPDTDYVLQNDIVNYGAGDCFTITADDVKFDGNGHTVNGPGGAWNSPSTSGIVLNGRTNVLITNLNLNGFTRGLNVQYSSNNDFLGVNSTGNYYGIYLAHDSNNNHFWNINFSNGYAGLNIAWNSKNNYFNGILSNNGYRNIIDSTFVSQDVVCSNDAANYNNGLDYTNTNNCYTLVALSNITENINFTLLNVTPIYGDHSLEVKNKSIYPETPYTLEAIKDGAVYSLYYRDTLLSSWNFVSSITASSTDPVYFIQNNTGTMRLYMIKVRRVNSENILNVNSSISTLNGGAQLKISALSSSEILAVSSSYGLDSSRVVFYDNFGNDSNPGGMDELASGTSDVIIPNDGPNSISVDYNGQRTVFSLAGFNLTCRRACGKENEAIDPSLGETCCDGLIASSIEGHNVCIPAVYPLPVN